MISIGSLFGRQAAPLLGLDISSSSVKLVELGRGKDGGLVLERCAIEPLERGWIIDGNVEKFDDGSGYRCDLIVQSGAFAFRGLFYFDDFFLKHTVAAIEVMRAGTPGEAVLKGHWEEDYVRFRMNTLGHVTVSGLLLANGGSTQSLKFEFLTDQTVFGPLVRDLAALHEA